MGGDVWLTLDPQFSNVYEELLSPEVLDPKDSFEGLLPMKLPIQNLEDFLQIYIFYWMMFQVLFHVVFSYQLWLLVGLLELSITDFLCSSLFLQRLLESLILIEDHRSGY